MTLPSQRTLRDFSHHIPTRVGFHASVDELLLSDAKMDELEDFKKYVVMHIKDELVYNKQKLIRFVNLNSVNNHLIHLEQHLEKQVSWY